MNDPTPPGSRASRGTAAGRTREVWGLGDCRTGAFRVPWRRCQTPASFQSRILCHQSLRLLVTGVLEG